MTLHRRTFSGTMLAGLILVSEKTEDAKLIFDPNQYVGQNGFFNVWALRRNDSREKNEWFICCDSSGFPIEFMTEQDAEDYIEKNGLEKYEYYKNGKNGKPLRDDPYPGLAMIRPVPTELHPTEFLGLDQQARMDLLAQIESEVSIPDELRPIFNEFFQQDNSGSQCNIWLEILNNKKLKSLVMQFRNSPTFCRGLRAVYCKQSYHSTLAKLECFRPSNPEE